MNIIKRLHEKWLRRKERRAIERFKKTLAEAYPEMSIFADRIQIMHEHDAFQLRGSICATGFVSAYGLSTSYREWEDKTIAEIKAKHPDLKVLVFHHSSGDESDNH